VITTKRAYEELEAEGFIHTMQGKGSFVAGRNLELIREEQLRLIEQDLQKAVDLALASDVSLDELVDLLNLLYKGV
jgi:GntR family transcriptional regulator